MQSVMFNFMKFFKRFSRLFQISAILYPNPMWDEDTYKTDIALMKLWSS